MSKWVSRRGVAALAIAGTVVGIGMRGEAPAEATTMRLEVVCQHHELPASELADRSVPLVSNGCDLRGRTIRAGVLAVDVPVEDGSVTVSGVLREGVQATAELPHDLTVTVRDGQVVTTINHEEESTDEPDVEPTGSHEPGPSEKPSDPQPEESEPQPADPDPTLGNPDPTPGNPAPTGTGDPADPDMPEPLPTDKPTRPQQGLDARAVNSECSQTAYKRAPVYNGYWEWYFARDTTPAYFGKANAEADIKAAARNIDIGYNDCGLRQSLGTDLKYKGFTFDLPDIYPSGRCAGRDRKNVVGFGAVDGNYLAWACRWTSFKPFGDDYVVEADVRIDNQYRSFFYYLPANCSNRYELQGVVTHEFGHVFGLGHVSEAQYKHMTMSTHSTPCSYRDKTLGRGDYNGLKKRYGA